MRQKVPTIMETLLMETEGGRMAPIPAGSQYVAMGSSFGAGPGLTPRAPGSPRRAGRSASNYAHLVARALGLDLRDVTYSGATTDDILRTSARGEPAQLEAVTPATRLVTLTAGGNDVGYLPRLTLASLPWPLRTLPKARAQIAGFGDPAATDDRFAGVSCNLQAIAAGVRDRAPAARVLFVDYLTVLPPAGEGAGPPPAGIADWGRAVAARLATTTQAAAQAAGAGYVAASAASADHHAWSATPWTRRFHLTLRGGAPYHPNAAGMAAVAGLVLTALETG
jgi:lysophospholipase L1-like esterase